MESTVAVRAEGGGVELEVRGAGTRGGDEVHGVIGRVRELRGGQW